MYQFHIAWLLTLIQSRITFYPLTTVDIGMMAAILFSAIVGDTGILEGDIPFHWIQHPQIVLKRWDVNFYSKMPLTLRKEHISQFVPTSLLERLGFQERGRLSQAVNTKCKASPVAPKLQNGQNLVIMWRVLTLTSPTITMESAPR